MYNKLHCKYYLNLIPIFFLNLLTFRELDKLQYV